MDTKNWMQIAFPNPPSEGAPWDGGNSYLVEDVLARGLRIAQQKLRSDPTLREVEVGLWMGLRLILRSRHPKPRGLDAYRKPVENR